MSSWLLRKAESRESEKEWERQRKLAWAVERGREPRRKLASAIEPARQLAIVERIRERMREAESREEEAEGMVKILGIWVVLFVLTCDCFVVNLLGWICSLSCWFLVCVEDNNVIFGQWFCLESMYNRIYQKFCFWVKRMYRIFLIHLKLFFFFRPYYPFFSKILGPLFYLGALGNGLVGLVEGLALKTHLISVPLKPWTHLLRDPNIRYCWTQLAIDPTCTIVGA